MPIWYDKCVGIDMGIIFKYSYIALDILYFHYFFFSKDKDEREKKENLVFSKEMLIFCF